MSKRITGMLTLALKGSLSTNCQSWPTCCRNTVTDYPFPLTFFPCLLCCIPLCFHFMLSFPLFLLLSLCLNTFTCVTFSFFLRVFTCPSPPSVPPLSLSLHVSFLFKRRCVLSNAVAMKTPILQHRSYWREVGRKSTHTH